MRGNIFGMSTNAGTWSCSATFARKTVTRPRNSSGTWIERNVHHSMVATCVNWLSEQPTSWETTRMMHTRTTHRKPIEDVHSCKLNSNSILNWKFLSVLSNEGCSSSWQEDRVILHITEDNTLQFLCDSHIDILLLLSGPVNTLCSVSVHGRQTTLCMVFTLRYGNSLLAVVKGGSHHWIKGGSHNWIKGGSH